MVWQGDVGDGFPARDCEIAMVKLIMKRINRLIRRKFIYFLSFLKIMHFFFLINRLSG